MKSSVEIVKCPITYPCLARARQVGHVINDNSPWFYVLFRAKTCGTVVARDVESERANEQIGYYSKEWSGVGEGTWELCSPEVKITLSN